MAEEAQSRKKPGKPREDFPLTAHTTGQWCKKIRGHVRYFGKWEDPVAAEAKYNREREDWEAGRVPRQSSGGINLKDLVNLFLMAKRKRVDNGEMSVRTWSDYKKSGDFLVEAVGRWRCVDDLNQEDFGKLREAMAKGRNMVSLGNAIRLAKVLFNWGFNEGHIKNKLRYGESFDLPTAKSVRKEKNAKPRRMFEAADLRRILINAGLQVRAMTLLGANCGFGNTDISELPIDAVDLAAGWVDFPRPKTAILRRCKLWPETVEALRGVLAKRQKPKTPDATNCLFVTRCGERFVRATAEGLVVDGVGQEFSKLLRKLDMKRDGLSFYALRHGFQTIGTDVYDSEVTIKFLMGHAPKAGDMSSTYREMISDRRIEEAVNAVRAWLWPAGSEAEQVIIDAQAAEAKRLADEAEAAKPKGTRKRAKKV